MSDELEQLPDKEKAKLGARDRKLRGPKVVVDNPGLRKVTLDLAEKRRQAQRKKT
jgi:hypothetical protein